MLRLVALGLVLIYRARASSTSRKASSVRSARYVMAMLFVNYGMPFGLSVPARDALRRGRSGALTELLVVRRLFNQPRLLLFVATLGVAQLILALQLQLPDRSTRARHVSRARSSTAGSLGSTSTSAATSSSC